jgi:hypothetical protein
MISKLNKEFEKQLEEEEQSMDDEVEQQFYNSEYHSKNVLIPPSIGIKSK